MKQDADTKPLFVGSNVEPVALAKDINAKLPVGVIGNPKVLQHCTMAEFLTFAEAGTIVGNECSAETAVGVARVVIKEPVTSGERSVSRSRCSTSNRGMVSRHALDFMFRSAGCR